MASKKNIKKSELSKAELERLEILQEAEKCER